VQSSLVASKLGTTRLVVTVGFGSSCAVCLTFVLLLLQIDQYCFGFVEFESQQSMQAAIQVCFIMDKLSFYNIYGDDVTVISCYDVGFSAIY
jgi:hypothetical protein